MANTFVNPSLIAQETLLYLENMCPTLRLVNTIFKKEFDGNPRTGGTVSIEKPVKFDVGTGADITSSLQDIKESSIDFTVDQRKHVPYTIPTQDLTLSVDPKKRRRHEKAAAIALSNYLDAAILAKYYKFYNSRGLPGAPPQTTKEISDGWQCLLDESAPKKKNTCVINPEAANYLSNHSMGIYVEKLAKSMFEDVYIQTMGGAHLFVDQNVANHTYGVGGTEGDEPTLSAAASDEDTTLAITGLSAGTIKQGDIFTVENCYAVNSISGAKQNRLRQFVVSSDVVVAGGAATVTVTPTIQSTMPYKTVYSLPANGARVYFEGTPGLVSPQNLYFQKEAIALVTVPLEMPPVGTAKSGSATHNGVHLRVEVDFNILTDAVITRFDMLYGVDVIQPELGCRIPG